MYHRFIMEEWLRIHDPNSSHLIEVKGIKYLKPTCIVHHIDKDTLNNVIDNLQIFENQGDHRNAHIDLIQKIKCVDCGKEVRSRLGRCKECRKKIYSKNFKRPIIKCVVCHELKPHHGKQKCQSCHGKDRYRQLKSLSSSS